MNQLSLRTALPSRQGGETRAFPFVRWIMAFWRGACRQAERSGRYVPYC